MKRGRLSNKEREYILENREQGAEAIAKKLGRSVDLVSQVLESQPQPKPQFLPKEMQHIGMSGKYKNAMVSTPMTSELSDELKKKKKSKLDPSIVFRPMGPDYGK